MHSTLVPMDKARVWKRFVLSGLASLIPLAIAAIGAVIVKDASSIDGVNTYVEGLSGNSSLFFGDVAQLVPLGFAFAAGVAAAFNPCGFAMLPAYVGLYLGDSDGYGIVSHHIARLGRALLVGGVVTAGFVVLFAVAGVVVKSGASSVLSNVLPWLGLGIGVIVALTGSWLLGGGAMYMGLATRVGARIGDPGEANVRGYFLFGLSYGIASLSCTLPIFLSVVGTTFAVSNIGWSLGQFVLYALGMGLVITCLAVGMALFKGAVVGRLRRALPFIQPIGSWLMILAGSYIVFYWLTMGDLLG